MTLYETSITIIGAATVIAIFHDLNQKGMKNCAIYSDAMLNLLNKTMDAGDKVKKLFDEENTEDGKALYGMLLVPVISKVKDIEKFSKEINERNIFLKYLRDPKKVFAKKNNDFIRYLFNLEVAIETNNFSEELLNQSVRLMAKEKIFIE